MCELSKYRVRRVCTGIDPVTVRSVASPFVRSDVSLNKRSRWVYFFGIYMVGAKARVCHFLTVTPHVHSCSKSCRGNDIMVSPFAVFISHVQVHHDIQISNMLGIVNGQPGRFNCSYVVGGPCPRHPPLNPTKCGV